MTCVMPNCIGIYVVKNSTEGIYIEKIFVLVQLQKF